MNRRREGEIWYCFSSVQTWIWFHGSSFWVTLHSLNFHMCRTEKGNRKWVLRLQSRFNLVLFILIESELQCFAKKVKLAICESGWSCEHEFIWSPKCSSMSIASSMFSQCCRLNNVGNRVNVRLLRFHCFCLTHCWVKVKRFSWFKRSVPCTTFSRKDTSLAE